MVYLILVSERNLSLFGLSLFLLFLCSPFLCLLQQKRMALYGWLRQTNLIVWSSVRRMRTLTNQRHDTSATSIRLQLWQRRKRYRQVMGKASVSSSSSSPRVYRSYWLAILYGACVIAVLRNVDPGKTALMSGCAECCCVL